MRLGRGLHSGSLTVTKYGKKAMRYERTAGVLESFTDAVSCAIIPLHQIARNQGFPMWDPAVEYGVVSL